MQQSGAAGGRGRAPLSLLGVLLFPGERAGRTSGRGVRERWSLFRFRVGGLRKAPTALLGGLYAGGGGEDAPSGAQGAGRGPRDAGHLAPLRRPRPRPLRCRAAGGPAAARWAVGPRNRGEENRDCG